MLEKGHIIEVSIPSMESTSTALVLDVTEFSVDEYSSEYLYILYGGNCLFKMKSIYNKNAFMEDDGSWVEEVHESTPTFEGIISTNAIIL